MCLIPIFKIEKRDSTSLDSLLEYVSVSGTTAGTNVRGLQELSPTQIPLSSQSGAGRGARGGSMRSFQNPGPIFLGSQSHPWTPVSSQWAGKRNHGGQQTSWGQAGRGTRQSSPNPSARTRLGVPPDCWGLGSDVCGLPRGSEKPGWGDTGQRYGAPLGAPCWGQNGVWLREGTVTARGAGAEGTGPTAQTS